MSHHEMDHHDKKQPPAGAKSAKSTESQRNAAGSMKPTQSMRAAPMHGSKGGAKRS